MFIGDVVGRCRDAVDRDMVIKAWKLKSRLSPMLGGHSMGPGFPHPARHQGVHMCHSISSSSLAEQGPWGGRGIPEEGPLLGASPESSCRNDLSLVFVNGKRCPGRHPKSAECPISLYSELSAK